jgi:hypothetical protein
MTRIAVRDVPPRAAWALEQGGVHPLLARLYAARGIRGADELDTRSSALLSPEKLKGAREGGGAAGRRNRRRPPLADRRRLRLRRRHRLRGRPARAAHDGAPRSITSCRTASRWVTGCRPKSCNWRRRASRTW